MKAGLLGLTILHSLLHHAFGQGLMPSCAPTHTLVADPVGVCGMYQCTSATAPSYCPCPFLYKDVSTKLDGSSCSCWLGVLCSTSCPAGYTYNKTKFTCDTPPPRVPQKPKKGFNIQLINKGCPRKYERVFKDAARRWEKVITADLSDFEAADAPADGWFRGFFNETTDYRGPVDDLVIGYHCVDLDGAGRLLARAGPSLQRARLGAGGVSLPDGGLPISGFMEVDNADLERTFIDGTLDSIIQHEMGHVLGIGIMKPTFPSLCASTCVSYDDGAIGVCHASEQFTALGGKGALLISGQTEYCDHWDEKQMKNELMTSILDTGVYYYPLSAITIGALEDLGYTVDYKAAEPLEEPKGRRHERARRLRDAHVTAHSGTPVSQQSGVLDLSNDIIQMPPLEHTQRRHR